MIFHSYDFIGQLQSKVILTRLETKHVALQELCIDDAFRSSINS